MTQRIRDALDYLTTLVRGGKEFPDAMWDTVEKLQLRYSERRDLIAAYDAVEG